jgi:NADH:ubiquinone oxidoreductase subunit 3 (subunit A)
MLVVYLLLGLLITVPIHAIGGNITNPIHSSTKKYSWDAGVLPRLQWLTNQVNKKFYQCFLSYIIIF